MRSYSKVRRQKAKGKRQKAKGKRQEAKGKRQKATVQLGGRDRQISFFNAIERSRDCKSFLDKICPTISHQTQNTPFSLIRQDNVWIVSYFSAYN